MNSTRAKIFDVQPYEHELVALLPSELHDLFDQPSNRHSRNRSVAQNAFNATFSPPIQYGVLSSQYFRTSLPLSPGYERHNYRRPPGFPEKQTSATFTLLESTLTKIDEESAVRDPLRQRSKSAPVEKKKKKRSRKRAKSADKFDEKKITLFKTELCRMFDETGECKFGDKCLFAHGQEELRVVERHSKYKTSMCQSFWENGTCKYGKRCTFIHKQPGAEIDLNDILLSLEFEE